MFFYRRYCITIRAAEDCDGRSKCMKTSSSRRCSSSNSVKISSTTTRRRKDSSSRKRCFYPKYSKTSCVIFRPVISVKGKGKGKAGIYSCSWNTISQLRSVTCHMGSQCYLSSDTSEHTPPSPQPVRPVVDLPTPEGWKAELT